MAIPTRIYLTGFMGSGKSTVGPRVAEKLGYRFVDLDEVIEARAGKSIPAIFQKEGEARFRSMEAAVLRETDDQEDLVVALGGGALAREENLHWALQHGAVVYLRVSPQELLRRLKADAVERPLLQDETGTRLPDARLQSRIATLLAQREPFYRRAHVVVETDGQAVDETVAALLDAVRHREVR